jgi:hypothetical protein
MPCGNERRGGKNGIKTTDRQTDTLANRRTHGRKDEQTDKQTEEGRTDSRPNRMDRQKGGRKEGQTDILARIICFCCITGELQYILTIFIKKMQQVRLNRLRRSKLQVRIRGTVLMVTDFTRWD